MLRITVDGTEEGLTAHMVRPTDEQIEEACRAILDELEAEDCSWCLMNEFGAQLDFGRLDRID